MDSARELSIGFLESHPKRAVSVLETLQPEDAAAFLDDVPQPLGSKVFEIMQPLIAAAILPNLARKKAAAVLQAMDAHSRSSILRVLEDEPMNAIMAEMPKGAARAVARFLHFPEGSVGAWMSSDVAVFERSVTVGECLAQLRALPDSGRESVLVIDEQKKLIGAASLSEVLAARDDASIDAIAKSEVRRLSPYARLTSTVALTAWDHALSLPVVDNKGRLLGALRFDRLREGLASEQRVRPEGQMGQLLAHLAEALLACATGVLSTPSTKSPLSRPFGARES